MKKVLFVCEQNRHRSRTAEEIFKSRNDVEVKSAGISRLAANVITDELVRWADIILVMDDGQKEAVQEIFPEESKGKKVISLEIPDVYAYMDPELVKLLERKAGRYL